MSHEDIDIKQENIFLWKYKWDKIERYYLSIVIGFTIALSNGDNIFP